MSGRTAAGDVPWKSTQVWMVSPESAPGRPAGKNNWALPNPAMPHIWGSTTPATRAQATAASTALPPARSASTPASTASG